MQYKPPSQGSESIAERGFKILNTGAMNDYRTGHDNRNVARVNSQLMLDKDMFQSV